MKRLLSVAAVLAVAAACGELDRDRTPTSLTDSELLSASVAGSQNFTAHLKGRNEVPSVQTPAQGQAILRLSRDGNELSYKLIVANIDNVFMAHIHRAPTGSNGPVVAWLYPEGGPPPVPIPGPTNGVLAEGTITAADLMGPLAGQPLSSLIEEIRSGNAYVNVHTSDFVNPPNTGPGDFPAGEIRGQIQATHGSRG